MKIILLWTTMLTGALSIPAQAAFQNIDLDWVLATYPERVAMLFQSLDLERPELRDVSTYVDNTDYRGACLALIAYYKSGANFPSLRHPDAGGADLEEAGRILWDTLTFQSLTAKHHRHPDGALDWTYRGLKDDEEWAHFLNRHRWFHTLLEAYRQSEDVRYAEHLNELLLDWIITNPYPVEDECCPQWRTLNTALRFSTWPAVFYGLQQSEAFTDAARILMLISVIEQGALIQRFHWTHQNIAIFQLNGLARIAVYWPELKQSDDWFDYATRHLLYEMEGQVLPDGVQNELTSMYHYITLQHFQEVMELGTMVGQTFPPAFQEGVEKMYHYLAFTMRPNGYNVLNNDSDLGDYRDEITRAAQQFGRLDWEYIITNGRQGQKPEETAVLFPYAGQVIMRNGWHEEAHWSFFDAGPHGMAHRHDDKLHLSVAAYGRDLLVDGGRYWYKTDIWREYFVSSYSHNVILVDGFGHKPDVNRYTTPDQVAFETTPAYTYAQATFDAGYRQVDDEVRHTRGVLYLTDRFWIVIDHLTSSGPHTVQPLWHFHPSCQVETKGDQVFSNDSGAGNLLIQPVSPSPWSLSMQFGPEEIEEPEKYREWEPRAWDEFPVKGAYSERYNVKQANYVAVYSGNLEGELTCAWLLIPFHGQERPEVVQADLRREGDYLVITVEVEQGGYRVELNLGEGRVRKVVENR